MRTYRANPSVGSRLAGVVKPSWGKAKIKLASDPTKLTGDPRSFGFNPFGPADLDARSPYRRTGLTKRMMATKRELRELDRFAHKSQAKIAAQGPRLIRPA